MSREKMPQCAEFVDALRDAFGKDEIDSVIRRGLRPDCKPEERVFFSEGGITLGQRAPAPVNAVSASEMNLILPLVVVIGRRGRR